MTKSKACEYCDEPFIQTIFDRRRTRDHRTPKSRGGSLFDKANFADACNRCNNDKGSMTEAEFRLWLRLGRPEMKGFLINLGISHHGKIPVRTDTKGYRRMIRRNQHAILVWLKSGGAQVDFTVRPAEEASDSRNE